VPGASFPSTARAPVDRINTLANLLNTCAVGTTANSCSQLFASTTPSGATAPTNTLDAILNLVKSPGINVGTLYTQAATSSAFSPALAKAPRDWTLFINYTGAGMNGPTGLALDSLGNVWVSNYYALPSKFSPTGAPLFSSGNPTGGLTNSYSIAVDSHDNVWVPYKESSSSVNNGLGSIAVFNSAGQPLSGSTGYSSGGVYYPNAIAFDTKGNAWVVDYGNSHVTVFSSSGQPLSGPTGYTANSFAFPVAVAIDSQNNGWFANSGAATITSLSPDGTKSSSVSCCGYPDNLAIDQKGYIWTANYYGDSVSQVSSAGSVISTGYTAASLYHPEAIAIDGSGNVWVASYRISPPTTPVISLTELAGSAANAPGQPLSPASGWGADAGLLEPFAIAVDASGNLWVSNFGNNTLTEFVGAATPVKTPLLGPPQAP
jgi:streptogramin lyase